MANIVETIVDHSPPVSGVSIPLATSIWIEFDRLMDETELSNCIFLEGPDTDQFVGPGLIELTNPDNISQGSMDGFLRSPGYTGIAEGTFTITGIDGHTEVTFRPTLPMAPSTTYTVHIVECLDANGDTISGHVTWTFETGTGSIQELPSNISTSVLAQALRAPGLAPLSVNPLTLITSAPKNHSVMQSRELAEIDVIFDKDIDATSVSKENISIIAYPATDHPNLEINAQGDIMFDVEVSGHYLKLKI